jgi:hypothetical protein
MERLGSLHFVTGEKAEMTQELSIRIDLRNGHNIEMVCGNDKRLSICFWLPEDKNGTREFHTIRDIEEEVIEDLIKAFEHLKQWREGE